MGVPEPSHRSISKTVTRGEIVKPANNRRRGPLGQVGWFPLETLAIPLIPLGDGGRRIKARLLRPINRRQVLFAARGEILGE